LPTLARVVVSDGTRIVMERSLDAAINALLAAGERGAKPAGAGAQP
jgi:uncharacterized membrane protein (UPF0182 family)